MSDDDHDDDEEDEDAPPVAVDDLSTKKRKRGRATRVVEPLTFDTELVALFQHVADAGVAIDSDAMTVLDEVMRRVEQRIVSQIELFAPDTRGTLVDRDLHSAIRANFIFTHDQERLVAAVKDAQAAQMKK